MYTTPTPSIRTTYKSGIYMSVHNNITITVKLITEVCTCGLDNSVATLCWYTQCAHCVNGIAM